jgi:PAS domain S-box-containing protein
MAGMDLIGQSVMSMVGIGAPPPGLSGAAGAAVLWSALEHDTGAVVAIVDEAGVVRACNVVCARVMGLPSSEIVGRSLHELFSREMAEERLGFIRRTLESGSPFRFECRVKGTRLDTVYRPLPEEPGQPRCILAVGRLCTPLGADDHTPPGRAVADDLGPLSTLTARELEVLRLIGEGYTTAEIAERLYRTVKTVEAHRASLGRKLGATNRVQLAKIAVQAGLVPSRSVIETVETLRRSGAGAGEGGDQ